MLHVRAAERFMTCECQCGCAGSWATRLIARAIRSTRLLQFNAMKAPKIVFEKKRRSWKGPLRFVRGQVIYISTNIDGVLSWGVCRTLSVPGKMTDVSINCANGSSRPLEMEILCGGLRADGRPPLPPASSQPIRSASHPFDHSNTSITRIGTTAPRFFRAPWPTPSPLRGRSLY